MTNIGKSKALKKSFFVLTIFSLAFIAFSILEVKSSLGQELTNDNNSTLNPSINRNVNSEETDESEKRLWDMAIVGAKSIAAAEVANSHPENWHESDNLWLAFLLSLIITWGIGLTPPLLIRYVFLRRPLSQKKSVLLCVFLWLINLAIFITLGSESKTHAVLYVMGFVSYLILTASPKRKQNTLSSVERLREL